MRLVSYIVAYKDNEVIVCRNGLCCGTRSSASSRSLIRVAGGIGSGCNGKKAYHISILMFGILTPLCCSVLLNSVSPLSLCINEDLQEGTEMTIVLDISTASNMNKG